MENQLQLLFLADYNRQPAGGHQFRNQGDKSTIMIAIDVPFLALMFKHKAPLLRNRSD